MTRRSPLMFVALSCLLLATPANAADGQGGGEWSTTTPWWCSSTSHNCQFYTAANHATSVYRTCSTAGSWTNGWKDWDFIDDHSCT